MSGIIYRLAIAGAATIAPLAFVTLVSPALSHAEGCGVGTVYDPPSDTCVAAQLPPPPPPAWNGDVTPHFSFSVCAPIPYVSLCWSV